MKKYIKLISVFAVLLCLSAFCVSAAANQNVFSIEEVDADSGIYKVTSVATKQDGLFAGTRTVVEFDNTIIVPVHKTKYTDVSITDGKTLKTPVVITSYYSEADDEDVEITYAPGSPYWNVSDTRTTLTIETYHVNSEISMTSGVLCFEMYFRYADGKTADDLVTDSFVVKYIKILDSFADTEDVYEPGAASNTVEITNNVVPEATVITIPVAAGDIVYLQDGTFATAAAAGNYEVPAEVGYVAVNTGYTSQKTYYVDGTTATEVHANGVVSKDEYDLRAPVASDDTDYGEDRSGLRFKMEHNSDGRRVENHEIVEVGFVMTAESNKIIAKEGENYVLDMAMVGRGTAKYGYAYNTADGTDFAWDSTDDLKYIITGVFYNIPMKDVQTVIASRPYYKVGDTYIYGEVTKTTLYDVAKGIKNSEGYDYLDDAIKAYVDEIIEYVDGEETTVVEDEVIINISGLYGNAN